MQSDSITYPSGAHLRMVKVSEEKRELRDGDGTTGNLKTKCFHFEVKKLNIS